MVTPAVTIRMCTERDLAPFESFSSPRHTRYCREKFAQPDVVILVAVDDVDVPVGKLHLERPNPRVVRIVATVVAPPLRNRGIGMVLMHAAESLACEWGAHTAELGVEDNNPRARRLYERLGYEAAEADNFVYEGAPVPNPAVWMRKELAC